jgi:hypothetical protein
VNIRDYLVDKMVEIIDRTRINRQRKASGLIS